MISHHYTLPRIIVREHPLQKFGVFRLLEVLQVAEVGDEVWLV